MIHFFQLTSGCPSSCKYPKISKFDYGCAGTKRGLWKLLTGNFDNEPRYGCADQKNLPFGVSWCNTCKDPPTFDLSKNTVPTVLYVGKNDAFSPPADMPKLNSSLGKPVLAQITLPTYAHLDFTWSMDAKDKVYKDMMTRLPSAKEARSAA